MIKIKYIILLNLIIYLTSLLIVNVNATNYYSSNISTVYNLSSNNFFSVGKCNDYFPVNCYARDCLFSYAQYFNDIDLSEIGNVRLSKQNDYDFINSVYHSNTCLEVLDNIFHQIKTNLPIDFTNFSYQIVFKNNINTDFRFQFWNYGDYYIRIDVHKVSSYLSNVNLTVNGIVQQFGLINCNFNNEMLLTFNINQLTSNQFLSLTDLTNNTKFLNIQQSNVSFSLSNTQFILYLETYASSYVFAEGSNIVFNRFNQGNEIVIDENFNIYDIYDFIAIPWLNAFPVIGWDITKIAPIDSYNLYNLRGTERTILNYTSNLIFNKEHNRYDTSQNMGFNCITDNPVLPSYLQFSAPLLPVQQTDTFSLIRVNNSGGLTLNIALTDSLNVLHTCSFSFDNTNKYGTILLDNGTYTTSITIEDNDITTESVIGFTLLNDKVQFLFGNVIKLSVYTLPINFTATRFTYTILNPIVKSNFCVQQIELHRVPIQSLKEILSIPSFRYNPVINSSKTPYLSCYYAVGSFSVSKFFNIYNSLLPVISKNCTYFYINQTKMNVYFEIDKNIVNPEFEFISKNERIYLNGININTTNYELTGYNGLYNASNYYLNFTGVINFIISDIIEMLSNTYNFNCFIVLDTTYIYYVEPFSNWDFIGFIVNLIVPLIVIFVIPFVLFYISKNKWIFIIGLLITPIVMYIINQITLVILIAIEPLGILMFIYMFKHNKEEVLNQNDE